MDCSLLFYSILSHSLGRSFGHHRWVRNNPFRSCPVFSWQNSFLLYSKTNYLNDRSAPVAQWVKRRPTDLVVPSSIPTRGKIFSTINWVPLHTAFYYHPCIVLIWLKYCWKGYKIVSYPSSIHLNNNHKKYEGFIVDPFWTYLTKNFNHAWQDNKYLYF